MKNVIAASSLLVLIAGSAFAASNERPDVYNDSAVTLQQERVNAKSLFSPKDALRAGLSFDATTGVTVFVAPSVLDERGNDN